MQPRWRNWQLLLLTAGLNLLVVQAVYDAANMRFHGVSLFFFTHIIPHASLGTGGVIVMFALKHAPR